MFEIGDFISRIKVAQISKDLSVTLRLCRITLELSTIFKRLGFIQSFTVLNSKTILFRLKYHHELPFLKQLRLISTPGHRVYWNRRQIALHTNQQSLGSVFILSTTSGLRTSTECLTTEAVGGEVLLEIRVN